MRYLGTIDVLDGETKTNETTATPFSIGVNVPCLVLVPDGAVQVQIADPDLAADNDDDGFGFQLVPDQVISIPKPRANLALGVKNETGDVAAVRVYAAAGPVRFRPV